MSLLLLKLTLTPLFIALVVLAGRRWGPGVSGWLAGLPLTSGPVSVFLALERGPAFAEHAALGSLAGLVAVAAFCVAYARLAGRWRWPSALAGGLLAFGIATAALGHFDGAELGLLPLALGVFGLTALALVFLPSTAAQADSSAEAPPPPWWDLPARMASATGIVLALTAAAPVLGPAWSGLLSPFPAFAAILAVFTQRHAGARPARLLLRGILLGTFAFAAFFVVVGATLTSWGLGATYAAACAVALLVNSVTRGAVVPSEARSSETTVRVDPERRP